MEKTKSDKLLEILTQFNVVSPDVMEKKALLRRTDTKFILSIPDLFQILKKIRKEYTILLSNSTSFAHYSTVYFDTPDGTLFHMHRCGRRIRYKVRIRNYTDRKVGFVEVKKRINQFDKQKFRLPKEYEAMSLNRSDYRFINKVTGLHTSLVKTAETNYKRITLFNKYINERVTIDLLLNLNASNKTYELFNQAIVEVKQFPYNRNTKIMEIVKATGYRACRISKYCTAIMLGNPNIRCNRLLPRVREVKGMFK